jgi:predicted small lipoprotein YifL
MLPRQKFASIALLSLTAGACGLKGPLVRPQDIKDEAVVPASEPQSTVPTKKKEGTSGSAQGERVEPPVSPPDPNRPKPPPGR